jgi:hypothetical protein
MSFIPDVFVIGATKAGTSSVWKAAVDHEQLLPTRSKEVNYFTRDLSFTDLERLYTRQFSEDHALKMDVSPVYSRRHAFPGVAQRIHRANSKAKIIYIVRNPVGRIISHLHHNLYRHRIRLKDVNRVVLEAQDYVKTSMYFFQIENYLKFFGKESILILEQEDMKSNPERFWSSLASFLSIGDFPSTTRAYNVSEKRYLVPFHDFIHHRIGNSRWSNVYHKFWYFIGIKLDRPVLRKETIEILTMKLRPDAERFGKEFGIDTS